MGDLTLSVLSVLWPSLLFSAGIFFLTLFLRKMVEAFEPRLAWSSLWRDKLLPVLPIVLGALAGGLTRNYPYPPGIVAAVPRIFFGIGMGGVSSWLYKIVKIEVKRRFDVDLSNAPDATPAALAPMNIPVLNPVPPLEDGAPPKETP